ncbi:MULTISPECIES: RelA/SpoT family protein [Clostridiaceae]|uniref:GTP diphosphokinase n=1 Tax=Clostridium facile TaxID=2763035 RepID=A0ABR7IU62_9CLOT|nr:MULTISPECIES: bifunctional (p)ppGpp synthetase/guanosine-3',5'-bis(diphosphate) 3'-pyrophosphohydrolase [Clostridiaceae]MBC5788594.1 bifunctional (p)ppGpp synthetase/guanosine-3',5'-bis(diphosphate) 3'-pyrophosphohydrolase [Clostridium facile]PWM99595.1 MAG: bifunctional (p)ppGpp synthetase/guanosine-3',5'-bis(diphosphate) 3'-pyrophosphohydrolase [Massilioclostridium sp.]
MEYTFQTLLDVLKATDRPFDLDKITKAYEVAKDAHTGQLRLSGEPYVTHPIAVACILAELGMDNECVEAALLHDVVEDTTVSLEEVKKKFGEDVALLVDGVTKLGKIPLTTKEEQQAENVRKMLLAMAKDIRVVIIKLADRLHNMRTAEFWPEQKQRDKSLETMEVYAPIAHRLGIRPVKEELEDLALQYLDPVAYREIQQKLKDRALNNQNYIEYIKQKIAARLQELNISAKIDGRVKSIYGIYRKVYMAGREFDEVYDIYAIRVIVDSVLECYNILGAMHDLFTPIPNRFKDYISMPKPNMYQSLHTTVIAKEGIPFEIQIRTWEMHYTAEYGIAAHWKYKEGIRGKDNLEERLAWVRQIIEAQQESQDAEDIMQSIKTDIGSEEVFVFTPKGDVKALPVGSTVIDFAYAIHSAVGNRMIGAKIDGRIVSLDTKLKTGQVVEIITIKSENHGPSRNWLKIVATSEARSKIRSWFKKERREENIVEGKAELERELKRNKIYLPDEQMAEFLEGMCKKNHCENLEEFYAAIGYGGISLSKIIPRVKEAYIKLIKSEQEPVSEAPKITHTKATSGVIVEGIDNCLVKFAQCCNPLPGDDIIGFITRGHGVSIHKKDCVNVLSSMKDPSQVDRWIHVRWEQSAPTSYRSTLDIVADSRTGLLADVSVVLANFRVPIHEINARELKNGNANIVVTIAIAGVEQLNNIIQRIHKIEGVISVERANK